MIVDMKAMGYNEVIIGTRNLLPIFDKHGDSNWFNLKLLQHLCGIYINMPVVGLFKWQVIKRTNGCAYFTTEKA